MCFAAMVDQRVPRRQAGRKTTGAAGFKMCRATPKNPPGCGGMPTLPGARSLGNACTGVSGAGLRRPAVHARQSDPHAARTLHTDALFKDCFERAMRLRIIA
jgi:hypothetical protein